MRYQGEARVETTGTSSSWCFGLSSSAQKNDVYVCFKKISTIGQILSWHVPGWLSGSKDFSLTAYLAFKFVIKLIL